MFSSCLSCLPFVSLSNSNVQLKHQKAVKNRKGQVQSIKRPTAPYGGETSGINAAVSRSIRFKSWYCQYALHYFRQFWNIYVELVWRSSRLPFNSYNDEHLWHIKFLQIFQFWSNYFREMCCILLFNFVIDTKESQDLCWHELPKKSNGLTKCDLPLFPLSFDAKFYQARTLQS